MVRYKANSKRSPEARQITSREARGRSRASGVSAHPAVHSGEGRWRFLESLDARSGWANAFGGAERALYDFAPVSPVDTPSYRIRRWDLGALDLPRAASGPAQAAPENAKKESGKAKNEPAPAIEAAVWLRYQDDTSDKFWFAERDGAEYRVRWGRRGAKPQSKVQAFATVALATTAYEKAVRRAAHFFQMRRTSSKYRRSDRKFPVTCARCPGGSGPSSATTASQGSLVWG